MAYTQAQHDALEAAIAEGAQRVKYEDRDVTYRTQAEMEALLAKMKRSLGLLPARVTLAIKAVTEKEA